MLLIVLLCSLLVAGCSGPGANSKGLNCIDCHRTHLAKGRHAEISCRACHGGEEPAKNKREAHLGLKSAPDYVTVDALCKNCHAEEAQNFRNSLHYSYRRELQAISEGFRLRPSLQSMPELAKVRPNLTDREGLILDFLKRRCLSCHIYTGGEDYPKTKRGLYCLSCHRAHSYSKPGDETCLSCHYSIRIGWDYYGLFPHNWYMDYRSPFVGGELPERPYGIEAYQLREDIHRKKGLRCVDCHPKEEIMFGKKGTGCSECHQNFKTKVFHRREILQRVRCEVCHARYLAQDELKVCYLSYQVDPDRWEGLTVQESSEIEERLTALLRGERVRIVMRDKFSGEELPGMWLCTLANRTFHKLTLGKDRAGKICLLRRERVELRSENFTARGLFENCKVPHTIGKGDLNRSLYFLRGQR